MRRWRGKSAGPNPWRATGLEWQTPSPPPKDNFFETPVVTTPPYQYHLVHGTPEEPSTPIRAGSEGA
jgi:cytochrome c oxidase subunit 1